MAPKTRTWPCAVAALIALSGVVGLPSQANAAAPNANRWVLDAGDMPKGWVTGSFVPGEQWSWDMMRSHNGSPAPSSAAQAIFWKGRFTSFWDILGSWPTAAVASAAFTSTEAGMLASAHTPIPGLGTFGHRMAAYRFGPDDDVALIQKGRALAIFSYLVESSPTAAHKAYPATSTFRSLVRLALAKVGG